MRSNQDFCCQPEIFKALRLKQNWTQKELAEKSGFSLRLISKAESGKPIALDTLKILAQTFSLNGQSVSVDDLTTDIEALAKRFIYGMYRFGGRVVSECKYFISDDITAIMGGEESDLPFAGEYSGIEEFEQMFAIFYSILEPPKDHDPAKFYQFARKSNDVFVWGKSWLHPIGVPMAEPVHVSIKMSFSNGKVVHFEDRFDTQKGAQVLSDNEE